MNVNKNTFGKDEKLKSTIAIEKLFNHGETIKAHPILLRFRIEESTTPAIKVLVTVPKKKFKRAVDRNLLKRRMREAYRLNNKDLKLFATHNLLEFHIAIVYTAKQIEPYLLIEEKIKVILSRLIEHSEVGSL